MGREIVVEAPDCIACADLVERLGRHAPQSRPTPGDGYEIVIGATASADALRQVLAAIDAWAEFWGWDELSIRVGGNVYRLRGRQLSWVSL